MVWIEGVVVAKSRVKKVVDAVVVPEPSAGYAPGDFFNRDLSWLEFNDRVLHEAIDTRNPLLERLRFLQIFTSNLDEFFQKRVGTLQRLAESNAGKPTRDGVLPAGQLRMIRPAVTNLLVRQSECFRDRLKPALRKQGIDLVDWANLTEAERAEAEAYFNSNVFPILTPLSVDPGHPFPFISNLSVSLGIILRHPDRPEENFFARVKVPEALPRWIRLRPVAGAPAEKIRFFCLYDLICHNLDDLFTGMRVAATTLFRVTRSAEAERDDDVDDTDDLRESVQQELRMRRFAPVVRVEHDADVHPEIRQLLMQELDLTPNDLYEVPLGLRYQDLRAIFDLKLPALSFSPWTPLVPPALADEDVDIFGAIRAGDLLVHHPYESFSASVERFVAAAANDPKVLAIKMTLYRTNEQSPFLHTLIRAAENRKQVVCLVELKARFDEERNITLTHALEKAGVHVVYGVVGLKTHSKTTLVIRQESEGIRCYAHIGTGNYNTQTANLYTDLGMFTCDPEITADLVDLFHYLTGRSLRRDYRKLLVAPVNMRQKFIEMIDREAAHAAAGRPAHIVAKMNSMEDRQIIDRLYAASGAGVQIDLIVRGFCCIRPGVEGKSERIRVTSVIGRFLEHSRLFYFRNGAADARDGEFFLGSADWMYRNLLGRVEVIAPVTSRPLRERLWELLQILLNDRRQAWELRPDGSYVRRVPTPPDLAGTHQQLIDLTRARNATMT
jgi:polyphosphate kinase